MFPETLNRMGHWGQDEKVGEKKDHQNRKMMTESGKERESGFSCINLMAPLDRFSHNNLSLELSLSQVSSIENLSSKIFRHFGLVLESIES